MAHRAPASIPVDLRRHLETARLDLLALFRALDRMNLAPAEIPQRLIRQLFELDADYAEALWAWTTYSNVETEPHAPRYDPCAGTVTRGHGQTQEEPSQTRPSYPGP